MFPRKQQIPQKLVNISLTVRVQTHLLKTVSDAQYNNFPDVISYPNQSYYDRMQLQDCKMKDSRYFLGHKSSQACPCHRVISLGRSQPKKPILNDNIHRDRLNHVELLLDGRLVKTEGVLRGLLLVAKDLSNRTTFFSKTSSVEYMSVIQKIWDAKLSASLASLYGRTHTHFIYCCLKSRIPAQIFQIIHFGATSMAGANILQGKKETV